MHVSISWAYLVRLFSTMPVTLAKSSGFRSICWKFDKIRSFCTLFGITEYPLAAPQAINTCAGVTSNFLAVSWMTGWSVNFGFPSTVHQVNYKLWYRSDLPYRYFRVDCKLWYGCSFLCSIRLNHPGEGEDALRLGLQSAHLFWTAFYEPYRAIRLTGTTPVASIIAFKCSTVKFDTPRDLT